LRVLSDIMNSSFLIPPPAPKSQADDQASSENGVTSDPLLRRKFLKRTGAAAVASVIAWNINTAQASVVQDSGGSGSTWKIKVDAVSFSNQSTGSEDPDGCLHDAAGTPLGTPLPSRKILKLTVTANATDWSGSAKSNLTITVTEHAQYQQNPTTQPNVWTDMTEAQYSAHRGGARDQHQTSASLQKTINTATGAITATTPVPSGGYNQTTQNITLTLSWSGDVLTISYGSSDIPAEEKTVEPVFHKKAFTSETPPEE
jgi:hypothetical protein